MIHRASWLCALVTLAACGDAPELPAPLAAAGLEGPRRGGTLRFAVADDIRTLDPAIAFDEFSLYAQRLLFDGLIGYKPSSSGTPLELVGALAESWTISADRLVYTFNLRAGIVYADGSPIVAEDFVDQIERILDPATPSPGKLFYGVIQGGAARRDGKADRVSGVRALDPRRLEVRLEKPDASFLMVMAMGFIAPVPRAYVERAGERIRDQPLTSGPFRLVAWEQGTRIIFERNPRYWNPQIPYLDRIELELQVSRDVAVLKFLRGELDTLERLSSDKYVQFMKQPEWKPYIRTTAANNVYGELMDVTVPPFTDKRVRQALNYALNKEDSYRIYNGRMTISHGALPPNVPGYDPTMKPYPHDPAKARQLLAEAGYKDGFDIDYYITKDEAAEKLAVSLQADLAEVGVRVHIKLLTFPAYLSAVGRHQLSFAYTSWYMDFPDPWDFLEVKFHSRSITPTNSNNETNFSNAEVDRLLDAARGEPDRAKRLAMYHRVEEILFEECPWIWHYHGVIVEVAQPYVKNYTYHPVYFRDYRETWLDKPGTTAVQAAP